MSERTSPVLNLLFIDDDDAVTGSVVPLLTEMGFNVSAARSGVIPDGFKPDVVICDYDLGMYDQRNGVQIVTDLKVKAPNARFIICSGLPREVPTGVEFFSKMDLVELLASLGEPECNCPDHQTGAMTPDDAAEWERDEVWEHAGEIMFDGSDRPDPDCLLCKRGIEMGAWAHFGVSDPFALKDADD